MDNTRGQLAVDGVARRWGASVVGIVLALAAGGCTDDGSTSEAFGGSAPGFGDGMDGEDTDAGLGDESTDGVDVEADGSSGGDGAETGTLPRPDDGDGDDDDDDRPDDDPGPSSTPPGGTDDGGDDGDPTGGTLPPEPEPEPHCCFDILFEGPCNEVVGCSWQGGDDNYCASDCDGLLQFQCDANPVCYWVGTEARICAPGDDTGPLDCSDATQGG